MTVNAQHVRDIEAEHVLQVYKRIPVVFVRGAGSRLFDADGKEYLDFLSGIGVASLGHSNTDLADALHQQAAELVHTSNLYFHPLQGEVASRLTTISGLDRVFFTNSGTEAVEACLKFARRYWHTHDERDRTGIVAFERSFHGRTFGSLSVTSGSAYREPFQPLVPGVTFVSPDDPAALRAAVTNKTAAIIVEPMQGEGGVWPISAAMAEAIGTATSTTGTLLIADEIQCGLGRTGRHFYAETLGLTPDLMSLGKALGAGVPVGAALVSQRVADAIHFGDHGSTYGGNLLACRAALVFLQALENGLLERVGTAGTRLEAGLRTLAASIPAVRSVRGDGLMWGLDVDEPVAERMVQAALERGLLINRTAGTVIRMLPPLTVSDGDLDEGLARLSASLEDAAVEAT